ncbi:hypothetical protein [Solirubrum puertoriconensis]|uniref:DUF3575 domain-containing protein n=1 Tax=Solirubrum puertoriconensis TaxID=1751427 RepID=A0A9X0HNM1_SOLP1|nr:hypothetical protein [Solirubrum puertoriconensis]KUG09356.1 hypothetical protein ASU33_16620 [Solirubrum puertoriconensis]
MLPLRTHHTLVRWHTLGAGLLLLSMSAAAQTQEAPPRPHTALLKVNAFQPLARSYQLEFEKQLPGHPKHSLSLTPQLYRGRVTQLTSDHEVQPDERMRGWGLELLHRTYLIPNTDAALAGFYLAYGPQYQRLEMQFKANGWQQLLANDGLTYYQYGPIDYTETIRRYGATAVLGYQSPLDLGRVYLDFYLGIGYRNTQFTSAFPKSRYRTGLLDYGYQGFYMPAGFKIGFSL